MGPYTQCTTTRPAANIATPACHLEMGILWDEDWFTTLGLGIVVFAFFIGGGLGLFALLSHMAASDDFPVVFAAGDGKMAAEAAEAYKVASAIALSYEHGNDWPAAAVAHAKAAAAAEQASTGWADAGYRIGMFAQNEEGAEYAMAATVAASEWMAESAHAYDRAAEAAVRSGHVQKATEFAASAHDARVRSLDIAGNAEFDDAERRVADTLDAMAGMDLP